MRYVGLMGGTFDPIHFGHLAIAKGALYRLALDQVLFVPNRQPPHKPGRRISAAEHRVEMVRLAIESEPAFALSTMELEREGPSYTIDTVTLLRDRHPDWRFAFIVGLDSLVQLQTWRAYAQLLTLVDLVVAERPGYDLEQRQAALDRLGPDLASHVRFIDTPGVAVGSTELRRLAAEGYPLRYLVPDAVSDYAARHALYR